MGADKEKAQLRAHRKANQPRRDPVLRVDAMAAPVQSAGNQAVQQLLRSRVVQARLEVSDPGDPYEREAERMAQHVAGMANRPAPTGGAAGQIQPTRTSGDGPGRSQPAPGIEALAGQAGGAPPQSAARGEDVELRLQSGSGRPLPGDTRAFMEAQFGRDFGAVRLHSGSEPAQMNRAIGAQAFTHGQNIYFGESEPDFQSTAGKQLLAHELTHTIQQGGQAGAPGTSHLVQRQAGAAPPATGGQVITLDPVIISNDQETQARLQAQSNQMMGRFPEVWRGFCRDWYDANLGALASVPDLPNAFEAGNFWKALAGNMVWAATSITIVGSVPGGAAVVVIGASALGAGAGSGVFQTGAPPSGRAAIARALAGERDRIERLGTRSLFAAVAIESLDASPADPDAQDRSLWHAFSNTIDFERRASVMLVNAQNRLSSWLTQYQEQYLEWKERDDVVAKARDYELGEIASEPFGSPITAIADLVGLGTPADRFFERAMADIPLRLVFTG